MTTQLQIETRKGLSRRPFQVGRKFNRRIFADTMYEDGVFTHGVGIVPHPDYTEHRVCPCCGWPA